MPNCYTIHNIFNWSSHQNKAHAYSDCLGLGLTLRRGSKQANMDQPEGQQHEHEEIQEAQEQTPLQPEEGSSAIVEQPKQVSS